LPAADQFILDGGNPVLELNLIFAHSGGVTPYINGQPWSRGDRDTQGLVEFRDTDGNILWWFNLPRSWDSEQNEQLGTFRFKKQGNSLYVTHRIPLSFVRGAVYPLMVDVTVDEQVGANADDGRHKPTTHFWSNTGDLTFGDQGLTQGWGSFQRFQTVAIPNAATIDVAHITYTPALTNSQATCKLKIEASDVDDAAAPADHTAYDAISWTTGAASVSWDPVPTWTLDVEVNTTSMIAVVQAIVDRAGWATGQDMLYRVSDYGELSDNNALRWAFSHDSDTAKAPKLHIEFTAGGAPTTRRYSLTVTGVG
ncbi:hypothetical protein LCGC14_2821930, partial [marine sediment metagenome]